MNLLPSSKPTLPMDDSMLSMGDESMTGMEDSQTSSQSGSETPKAKKSVNLGRICSTDTTHVPTNLSDLIEYEWPLGSGDRYFIQEQIADLLDVKSFKRKYPLMPRHSIEGQERQYLFKDLSAGDVIPAHLQNHLTAVDAENVLNMMATDYVLYFAQYQKVLAERRQRELVKQQNEMKLIQMDASKLAELRKQAIKNVAEMNKEYQTTRRAERRFFYDPQTSIFQCPMNKVRKLPPELTKSSLYPVALTNGQYQEYYKIWSSAELKRLPLNTVLDNDKLFPPRKDASPPPIHVTEEEVNAKERAKPTKDEPSSPAPSTPKSARLASRRSERNPPRTCNSCNNDEEGDGILEKLLKCTQCSSYIHARCAEMTVEMVRAIRSYNWCCIDCKTCTVCNKPDEEASMMCCDLCDRGYHTFCVGLNEPPSGNWLCNLYCKNKQR